jgi:S1-C subfamily serine protease
MQVHDYDPRTRPDPVLALMRPVFLVALLIFAVLAGWFLFGRHSSSTHDPDAVPRAITPRGDLAADEKASIELFERVSPSVVHITSLAVRRDRFNFNVLEIPRGTGSGFIWSADGYVVTNFHVIQNAEEARVKLADQSDWRARLVGYSANKDLAVLKIEVPSDRVSPIMIGTSRNLRVGQKVFAIGNPFGLDQSMSTGIISGVNREIKSVGGRLIHGVIQTDAAINPGNSGGPLLDSAGRLIGVNAAIATKSGTFSGVGFAVPVDTVNRIVPDLIRDGKVTRAGLGIYPMEDFQARRAGIQRGVAVFSVAPGSAAEKAGMLGARTNEFGETAMGDVIIEIAGNPIKDRDDLYEVLERFGVGDEVAVIVVRGRRKVRLKVKLQALY